MSSEGVHARRTMRVLRISHSAVMGGWRERERALRRRGVDVTLVSAAVWDEGGQAVTFVPGDDRFAVAAKTRFSHPNAFLFDPRPIWRLLRQGPWDLVDIHEEPCSLAAAEVLLLLRVCRGSAAPPVVLYSAQNLEKRFPVPFRWFERYALRTAAGLNACNKEAQRILVRKGFRGVASVIPLGVDTGRFAAGQDQRCVGKPLVVGYAGRLDRHKGVHVLLSAAAATRAPVSVDIVGDGPERRCLESQALQEGIADRVTFAGALDQDQLPSRYRTFDVIAIPSIPTPRWDEQFCRVAVEAMASGVPIVASRTGALPEVIGAAGLLVPPDDPPALTAALDRLAREPGLRAQLRTAGLRRSPRFSWDSVADQQLSLYRQVLARPSFSSTPACSATEVIVVAYGAPDLLARCLTALHACRRVIVVDNSSSSEIKEISGRHKARYVDPRVNLGFAAGVNLGLQHLEDAGSDVLLLNPDAAITPEAVDALERALHSDPALACAAPRQVTPDGQPVRVGWPFPSPAGAWLEAIGVARLRPPKAEFVIGSVLLLRRDAIHDVGSFDERYFLYAEEADWQRRATERGWKVRLCPDIEAVHVGAGTGGDPSRRERLFHASQEQYIRKHRGRVGWQIYRAAVLTGAAARALLPGSDDRRGRAGYRLKLYARGPSRAAQRTASCV